MIYHYTLKVSEKIPIGKDAVALCFSLEGKDFEFKAGQYISLELDLGGQTERRLFSLSSSPLNKDFIEITLKKVNGGLVSGYIINKIKVGDELKIKGPFGRFTLDKEVLKKNNQLVLIASGSGIAPFMSFIRYFREVKIKKIKIKLLYSSKTKEDILWDKEIKNICQDNTPLELFMTLTQEKLKGYGSGRINKEDIFYDIAKESALFYVCGSDDFVSSVIKILVNENISAGRIKKEIY